MKRHPPKHRSKPLKPPTVGRSNQPPQRKLEVKSRLGRFVWARPLAVLGGAWIVVVVVALVALSGLLSPDASNGKRTTEAAIAGNPAATTQLDKRQNRLPLWLFGAIALSCAAGSILISKQAMRPARPQKSTKPKHLRHYPTPVVPEPLEPSLQPTLQPAPVTMPSFALDSRSAQTGAAPFVAPVTLMQLAQMQLTHAAAPTVEPSTIAPSTAVPPEAKTPLDWGEASLADQLDLRKRRSVSSLL